MKEKIQELELQLDVCREVVAVSRHIVDKGFLFISDADMEMLTAAVDNYNKYVTGTLGGIESIL